MDDLYLFFIVPFAAVFCLTAVLGWLVARALWRRRWPSVPGKILRSSVAESTFLAGDLDLTETTRETKPTFVPQVAYAYEVAGKSYEGNVVQGFSPPGSEDRAWAEAMVARWTPGTAVSVYYRPSRPGQAYLLPRAFPRVSLVLLLLSLIPLWLTARLYWAFAL